MTQPWHKEKLKFRDLSGSFGMRCMRYKRQGSTRNQLSAACDRETLNQERDAILGDMGGQPF